MKIIDTYADIPACFPGGEFSIAAWRAYADSIHPALRKLCEEDAQGYNFAEQIAPVLADYLRKPALAQQAHKAFLAHTAGLAERFTAQLGAPADVTVVLYLGLCGGAGWACELDGQPFVLLGIEKIVELNWCDSAAMAALIYHEAGHLWHFQHRSTPEFPNSALWQLYAEGMAMLLEQEVCGDPHYFHQDKDGWLDWCETHRNELFAEYLRRVDAGEAVQDFFGDWCSYCGHSDVGYYLGCVMAREMLGHGDLLALCNAAEEDVRSALRKLAAH